MRAWGAGFWGLFPLRVRRGQASRASGRQPGSAALLSAARGRGPGDRRTPGCAEPAWAARGGRGSCGVRGVSKVVRARTLCPPPVGAPPASFCTPGQDRDSGREGRTGVGPPRSPSPPRLVWGNAKLCARVCENRRRRRWISGWQGVVMLSCASEFPGRTHTFVNGRWRRG